MRTPSTNQLPINKLFPLYLQIDPKGGVSPWMRVGTLVLLEGELRVKFDDDTAHVAPVWSRCIEDRTPAGGCGRRVHFAVREDSGNFTVVAEGCLRSGDLVRAEAIASVHYGYDPFERRCKRAERAEWRKRNGVYPRFQAGWPNR